VSATNSTKKTIGTTVAFLDVPKGAFGKKRFKMINSRELLRSLHVIKDNAVEEHTKNNLQILIDQIYESDLNV